MDRSRYCPQCTASFKRREAKTEFGFLLCPECGHRFTPDLLAVTMELPQSYSSYVEDGELVIKRNNRTIPGFIILPFILGIGLFLFIGLFSSMVLPILKTEGDFSGKIFPLLLASLFLFIIFFVPYNMIGALINITETRVNDSFITITTYPLPTAFKKVIVSSSVEQIYCKHTHHRPSRGRSYTTYELMAILKDGRRIRLEQFDDISYARAYEILMERHLGIVSEPVDGEDRSC